MKLIALCLLLLPFQIMAQDFQPDWYILEPGTTMYVKKASLADEKATFGKPTAEQIVGFFTTGEVVLVTDKVDDSYIANDPIGRTLYLKGNLTKVKHTATCGVGEILEQVKLVSGDKINRGAYVWITGQNAGNGTYTVQYKGGAEVEVPAKNVNMTRSYFIKDLNNNYKFTKVPN